MERGFSINKECLVDNQLPRSIIAQRIVYDALQAVGGVQNLPIDKQLILAFRNARDLYGEALKAQRTKKQEESQRAL